MESNFLTELGGIEVLWNNGGSLLIIAIFSYLAALFTKFINTKKQEVIEKTNNEKIAMFVEYAANNAITVVESLNATIVKEARAKSEDGSLSKDDIEDIRKTASDMMLNMMSDEMKNVLTKVFGNLEIYISNLLEKTLSDIKKNIN
jgi:hypothetical protein